VTFCIPHFPCKQTIRIGKTIQTQHEVIKNMLFCGCWIYVKGTKELMSTWFTVRNKPFYHFYLPFSDKLGLRIKEWFLKASKVKLFAWLFFLVWNLYFCLYDFIMVHAQSSSFLLYDIFHFCKALSLFKQAAFSLSFFHCNVKSFQTGCLYFHSHTFFLLFQFTLF